MKRVLSITVISSAYMLSCSAHAYNTDTTGVTLPTDTSLESTTSYLDEQIMESSQEYLNRDEVSLFKPAADQTDVTSLQETMESAYMQSSELDAFRARQRVTDENVAIAASGYRPSASIQFQQRQSWVRPSGGMRVATPGGGTAIVKRRNRRNYDSAFVLEGSQNVFAGGGTYAQTEGAKETVFAGREALLVTEQKVLLEAIQSHLAVITNEAIAELRKSSENFLHKTWEQTQVRYEVGEVTRTEVEAAKAGYLGARSDRIGAEGAVETARATYGRVVGSPAGQLGKAEILSELPANLELAHQAALANNPAVKQALHTIEAAAYGVNEQIATLLPSIDVTANIGRDRAGGSGVSLGSNRQTTAEFLTTVTVPIYRKGESRARIRQAHQQVAQTKVDLVTAKREALEAATRAWEDMQSAKSQVESLEAKVKSAALAVEGVSEEAAVGTKNVLDVLEQEENLVNTQISLVQAEQNLVTASYQLLQAIGHLNSMDMDLSVEYYDPEKYYDEHSGAFFKFWKGDDYTYVKDQDEDKPTGG